VDGQEGPVDHSSRRPKDRAARRGARGWALALVMTAAMAGAVPAGAGAMPPSGPWAPTPPTPAPDPPAPRPPTPVTPIPTPTPSPAPTTPAPAQTPRPVAPRPTAGGTGAASDASLAVRRLSVRAQVDLTPDHPARFTVAFVPPAGCLVAEVRLYRRTASRPRALLVRRSVAVRSGRRATVHLEATGLRAGRYEVSVRAGAGRATLGPAVVARLRVD
jgi:hypothetical protein